MKMKTKQYRYLDSAAMAAQNGSYPWIDAEAITLPWELHYGDHTAETEAITVMNLCCRSGREELLLIDDSGTLWRYYSDIGRVQKTRIAWSETIRALESVGELAVILFDKRITAYALGTGQPIWSREVGEGALLRRADDATLLLYDPASQTLLRLNGGGETLQSIPLQPETTEIAGFEGSDLVISPDGEVLKVEVAEQLSTLEPGGELLSAELTAENGIALLLYDPALDLNKLLCYRLEAGASLLEDSLLFQGNSLHLIRRDCKGRLWYLDGEGRVGYAAPERRYLPQDAPLRIHIDSFGDAMRWHRMVIDFDLPDECTLRIEAAASDETVEPVSDDFVPLLPLHGDLLLPELTGRRLYLRLYLGGDQAYRSAPALRSLTLFYPRSTYLEYLPAYYREDAAGAALLERFLSIFETLFSSLETERKATPSLIDAAETPEVHLAWLGGWLGLDSVGEWETQKLRTLIREAPRLFRIRGTREGIERIVEIYSGRRPLVYEPLHSQCAELGIAEMDNYTFCLFLTPEQYHTMEEVAAIRRIVEEWKPAYTIGRVVPLEHRIVLGSFLFLGVNTKMERNKEHLGEARMPFDGIAEARSEDSRALERVRIGHDAVLH